VYYTDEAICDVLLHGIADNDICRDALGAAEIQTKSVANVIALGEGKETTRDANPPPATNAASFYRHTHSAKEPNPATPHQRLTGSDAGGATYSAPPSAAEKAKTASCQHCRKNFHIFTELRLGWNKTPHECCIECWRTKRGR
jgi:hypothetical protein